MPSQVAAYALVEVDGEMWVRRSSDGKLVQITRQECARILCSRHPQVMLAAAFCAVAVYTGSEVVRGD